jgi:hypothetical protein
MSDEILLASLPTRLAPPSEIRLSLPRTLDEKVETEQEPEQTSPWYVTTKQPEHYDKGAASGKQYRDETGTRTPHITVNEMDHTVNPGLYGLAHLGSGDIYITNAPNVEGATKAAIRPHEETHQLRSWSGRMIDNHYQEELEVRRLIFNRTGDLVQLGLFAPIKNDYIPIARPIGVAPPKRMAAHAPNYVIN